MQETIHGTAAVLAGPELSFDVRQLISGRPALPPAITALIARWDASRPAADLIAAINERCEQQFADATAINAAKTVKKRGKCMTRRPGQDGSKEYVEGGWYKVRVWVDVAGGRTHPSIKICPVEGPGALKTSSERRTRLRLLIAEFTGKNKEVVESDDVTYREQAEIMMEQMRTRCRKPVAKGTLESYDRTFRLHHNPILGEMPISQIYSPELNLVVRSLLKKGMAPSSMARCITIAKSVVLSAVNKRTGEALYPRVWNAKIIDLPIEDSEELNTPSFSREILTGIVAYYSDDPLWSTMFAALGATGPRISEMLGVEIDKHLSPDFRTISIEQQADGPNISNRLKTPASRRQIDVHSDVAALIQAFAGDRKSGFLFQTSDGTPFRPQFVRGKLHLALEAIGFVNERTGTHSAGCHAFRRSRDTYLRNETSCPQGLYKFWLGHAFGKDMSERYDKVKRDRKLRLEWAERCGYGFDLPSTVPAVLDLDAGKETA
jgi:integrase